MSEKTNPVPPPQIQIEIDPAVANGAFINMAWVNHTETEFTLDLIYVQPQPPPKASVRARIITTPKHAKRLLAALQENIAKYEARFGEIDLAGAIQFPDISN
jgi:hypothetical protein